MDKWSHDHWILVVPIFLQPSHRVPSLGKAHAGHARSLGCHHLAQNGHDGLVAGGHLVVCCDHEENLQPFPSQDGFRGWWTAARLGVSVPKKNSVSAFINLLQTILSIMCSSTLSHRSGATATISMFCVPSQGRPFLGWWSPTAAGHRVASAADLFTST